MYANFIKDLYMKIDKINENHIQNGDIKFIEPESKNTSNFDLESLYKPSQKVIATDFQIKLGFDKSALQRKIVYGSEISNKYANHRV